MGIYVGNTCYKTSILNVDRSTYTGYLPLKERYSIIPAYACRQNIINGVASVVDCKIRVSGASPYDEEKYDVKFGLIKDLSILEDLKDNKDDVYERIKEYAERDEGTTYVQTLRGSTVEYFYQYEPGDFEKNAIYYFYIKYPLDGRAKYTYYDTEGIVLLQGTDEDQPILTSDIDFSKMSNALYAVAPDNDTNQGEQDVASNSDNVVNDDNKVEEKNNSVVENPNTGDAILICSGALIIGICIYKYSRRKMFKY